MLFSIPQGHLFQFAVQRIAGFSVNPEQNSDKEQKEDQQAHRC
jgi:hypothetical protein